MNIKEKLKSLNIDVENDKEAVKQAKEKLKKNRIDLKIDASEEAVLEDMFSNRVLEIKMKTVKAPATIKSDEDMPVTPIKKNKKATSANIENKDEIKNDTEKTNDQSSDNSTPFWKRNKSNIVINIHDGKNNQNPNSPNGNPLPQSTIDEIKNKKTKQDLASDNKQTNDKQQSKNVSNARDDKNKRPTQNNQNQNQKDNREQKDKNVKFKKFSQHTEVNVNLNHGNLTIGTNNKFDGTKKEKNREKDKEKNWQNKDKENVKKKQPQNKQKRIDINNFDEENDLSRNPKKKKNPAEVKPAVVEEVIKEIELPEVITVQELSSKIKQKVSDIVKKLFLAGKIINANSELTYEEAENIAIEYNILCSPEQKVDVIEELLKEDEEDTNLLVQRPPVVCVMGHVDHGKTSILDVIRKTNVIEKEAGGITQHIGAYQVNVNDRLITFLDTPGHEAFTAMRLRGAKSTDIAVLVVAADDGVKPQTIEAINHAKAANVEVVVAVNKIDKPEANVDKVKQELMEYNLIPPEWGGQTTFCEVSAKKNIGIQNLLEMILVTADMLELKANPNRKARGIVIEAELDKGRGPIARVLVQKGTLKVGDFIAMGSCFGRVRAMIDCNGQKIKEALPSTPIEILGLNETPQAGDTFVCFNTEKEAKNFANTFISENKKRLVENSKQKVSLDALFEKIKAGEVKELPIIVKADVMGSAEAVTDSLEKISNEEVSVHVIHKGVGNINESDVNLASASNAIIIGFNIKTDPNIKSKIESEKVDVRLYNIIYNAIDDVEKAMKGMLAPVFEEHIIGHLTIRQIFKASSVGNIAGSFVNDGEIRRNAKARVIRNDKVIFDGNIASLKRFKEEAKEVKTGNECGVVFEGFNDFLVDDTIEVYVMEEKKLV